MKYLKLFENYSKKVIYFAHPTSTYYTSLEDKCIKVIEDDLNCSVMNPSSYELQNQFKEFRKNNPDNYMVYFKELIDQCDGLVYIGFPPDWKIGAGIVYESIQMNKKGGELYYLDIDDYSINPVNIDYIINNKLSIEETRARLKTNVFDEKIEAIENYNL